MAIGSTKTQAGEPETLIGVIARNAKDLGSACNADQRRRKQ